MNVQTIAERVTAASPQERRDIGKKLAVAIELLISVCDEIDGDPDLENETDREVNTDFEPSLGALTNPSSQGAAWSIGGTNDLEHDDGQYDAG